MTENILPFPSILESIRIACELLLEEDWDLFTHEVHERTLTQNLARHLEEFFKDFSVDCEYNRDGNDPKEIPQNDPENPTKKVIPDIIIHKRGCNDHNLVVIEAKCDASDSNKNEDCKKLQWIKEEFNYEHAFFINFIRNKQPFRVDIYDLDSTKAIFSVPYDLNS